MSTAKKTLLTPAEYLAREARGGIPQRILSRRDVCDVRRSLNHTRIKGNLERETGRQLEDGPCSVYSSDLRVKVTTTGLYTYPDLVVVCGEPELKDEVHDTLLNPRVIVEVLSDSTEKYDRGTKFSHYWKLPSLQEYVLVSQDRPLVERFVRQPDENWLLAKFDGLTQTFEYATIPVKIALTAIYKGVSLPDNPQR